VAPNLFWDKEANTVAKEEDIFRSLSPDFLDDAVKLVKRRKCCTLYIIGHQGGNDGNPGGAWAYDTKEVFVKGKWKNKGKAFLPNLAIEQKLAELFRENCGGCAINIYTCGGTTKAHRKTRKDIAKRTGCFVCGSVRGVRSGGRMSKKDILAEAKATGSTYLNTTLGKSGRLYLIHNKTLLKPIGYIHRWRPECESPYDHFPFDDSFHGTVVVR